jgi:hypothetical protein
MGPRWHNNPLSSEVVFEGDCQRISVKGGRIDWVSNRGIGISLVWVNHAGRTIVMSGTVTDIWT